MEMQNLLPEQAQAFLDSANYLEPMLNMGEKVVHFGVDNMNREFILIASLANDAAKLGFI